MTDPTTDLSTDLQAGTGVNLLIVAGTDINFPDSLGLTPLMHAVVCHQPAIQTMLLYNGADVNSMDHFYETALVKAVV